MDAIALNKLYENELNTNQLVSPEQSLRVAQARSGKRTFLKSIFYCWPNLEDAARNLARLVSHQFPNENGTGFLLDDALIVASAAYEREVSMSLRDTKAMTTFLDVMLDVVAAGLSKWRVHGISDDGVTNAWPAVTLPIFEWIKKRKVAKIVFTKRDGAIDPQEICAMRILLTSASLTLSDVINVTRDKSV